VGGERAKGEDDEEWMGSKYFIWMYENRIMKLIKSVKSGGKEDKQSNRGGDLIKVRYMLTWKYHH
jgi:hypothetical protein